MVSAMARITTSNHGARFLGRQPSMSWSITIGRRGYRSNNSLGLQAYGANVVKRKRPHQRDEKEQSCPGQGLQRFNYIWPRTTVRID